jgi:hypothetical protein
MQPVLHDRVFSCLSIMGRVRARSIAPPTQTHHARMVALVLLVALHALQVSLADGFGELPVRQPSALAHGEVRYTFLMILCTILSIYSRRRPKGVSPRDGTV